MFWIVGPDYEQPRAEFDYIAEFLKKLDAIASDNDISIPKEGSCRLITKTGQVVRTRTSSDVRKLAAKAVDGIILAEAGQGEYQALLKSIGRVAETRGWVHACGTLEGSTNWYAQLVREWEENPEADDAGSVATLPTWTNLTIFPGGRDDPQILDMEAKYSRIPGFFEERCGAVAAPPYGVIFREFSYTRHVKDYAVFNPRLPVYLAIDPSDGGPAAYAVGVCQFYPESEDEHNLGADSQSIFEETLDYCHVVDAIYIPGGTSEQAIAVAMDSPWWDNIAGGAIDATAPDERRRWATVGVSLAAKKIPVPEGERRLHTFLHSGGDYKAHLILSSSLPGQAVAEFMKYRSAVDTIMKMDNVPSGSARRRAGPDHLLNGLWYLLIARYGYVRGKPQVITVRQHIRRLFKK